MLENGSLLSRPVNQQLKDSIHKVRFKYQISNEIDKIFN